MKIDVSADECGSNDGSMWTRTTGFLLSPLHTTLCIIDQGVKLCGLQTKSGPSECAIRIHIVWKLHRTCRHFRLLIMFCKIIIQCQHLKCHRGSFSIKLVPVLLQSQCLISTLLFAFPPPKHWFLVLKLVSDQHQLLAGLTSSARSWRWLPEQQHQRRHSWRHTETYQYY